MGSRQSGSIVAFDCGALFGIAGLAAPGTAQAARVALGLDPGSGGSKLYGNSSGTNYPPSDEINSGMVRVQNTAYPPRIHV
jgi:hypothetical protein